MRTETPSQYDRRQKRIGIGKVNGLLKHGIPGTRRGELKAKVDDLRWMAGVWYMRLCHGGMDGIEPMGDALLEGRVDDARRIYDECCIYTEAFGGPYWQPDWENVLSRYAGCSRDNPRSRRDEFWAVINHAMLDYRLKCTKSRAQRRWQLGMRSSAPYPALMNQYAAICSICRATIIGGVDNKEEHTAKTNHHTLPCALWFMWKNETAIDQDRMMVLR